MPLDRARPAVPRSGGRRAPRHARAEGADRSSKAFCPACTAVRSRASASSSPSTASTFPATISSTIDWKVYARSDRYYVKKFEEETNLDCHLMLDVSGSMGYGSPRDDEVRVRRLPRGVARLPDEPAARRRRPDRVRRAASSRCCRRARGRGHLRALLVTLDRLKTGARDQRVEAAAPARGLADQARHGRADLGSARRSRRRSSAG